MCKKILSILLLGICILVCGCGTKTSSNQALEAPPIPNYKKSDTANFDIYLDGTTSMYGYVNYAGGTVYVDAVKGIERTITENWKKEKVQYIKFGDDFKDMSRDEFLQLDKPSFYDQKDTSLQKVIEHADNKKVNVIVTDLFQTNQDIDSLLLELKRKCFADGKALAIIGMKSQYNGKIFDVGKNLASFDYASTDDPNSYRPFYLLVFGDENDTREFVINYEKQVSSNSQMQVVFLTHDLGVENTMEADKIPKDNKEAKDKKEKGTVALAEISTMLRDSKIKQYRLKTSEKLSKADVRIFSKKVLGKCPDAFSVKVDKIEQAMAEGEGKQEKSGIIDKILGREKNNNIAFKEISAEGLFSGNVTDIGLKNGVANFATTIKLDPVAIHKKVGKYRVQFSLIPEKEKYMAATSVFDKWSFDDGQVGEDAGSLVTLGNKTLNIAKFVNLLSNMNYELNEPGIHDNYIYIDAI